MQVTKNNFKETLPLVSAAINNATFLAIDAEFSGLDTGLAIHSFDSLQERYRKQRRAVKSYIILQFGLSAFQYIPDLDHYQVQSFNFYICPRPYGRHAPDVRFSCQSSSIDFLSSQGLDFNKVFHDGIPYLLPSESQKLLEGLKQCHDRHGVTPPASSDTATPTAVISKLTLGGSGTPSPSASPRDPSPRDLIAVPEQHQPFIANLLTLVDEFLQNNNAAFLDLEPCNGFMRKLTYQAVQQKYGKKLRLESVNTDRRQHIRVTIAKTAEEYEQMEKNRQNMEYEELENATGFSKVIRLISESSKLVVGHNMILDMMHIIEHFVSPLPEQYEEFKDLFRCVFPRILDNKMLATSQDLKNFLPNTTLADMQKDLEKAPFCKPKVVAAGGDVGYSNQHEHLHEAGYDSYITGLCFVSMTDYLGSIAKPPVSHVEADSPVVRQFRNKLYLMRMTDISFINLEGPDANVCREHVFHLTFPETWKAENISQLFSLFGNVQIAWLDESSAFVGLHRRDQASAVIKSLMSTPDRVYRLLSYAEYCASMSTTQHTHVKRKLMTSEVGVSSPLSIQPTKNGQCLVESVEMPPIPKEDRHDVDQTEVEISSEAVEDEQTTDNDANEPSNKKSRLSTEGDITDKSEKMFDEPTDW